MIVISLILTACGVATATATQPPTETEPPTEVPTEPATEVPTEVPTEVSEAVELVFWFEGTPEEQEYLGQQIDTFISLQEQPVTVTRRFFSFEQEDYEATLAAVLAAGAGADVAAISLNFMAELRDLLLPLEISEPGAFREDALTSGQLNGTQYGLALRQFGCVPEYQYLVQPIVTNQPELGKRLIDFLTSPDQQGQAYDALVWVPTLQSVYADKGVPCPEVTPILLSPDAIAASVEIVKERESELEGVLDGIQLDPYEAVTIIEGEVIQGTLAARLTPFTEEEISQLASGDEPVIVGAMFIDNAPEYPEGAYVLKCTQAGCIIVDSAGSNTDLQLESFEPLQLPIARIVVLAVEGSIKVPICVPFVGCGTARIG
jgi:hypothetical protein